MKGSAGSLGLSRLFEICLSIESSEDQLGRYLELLEPLVAAQRMSVDSLIAVLDKYTD